MKAPSNYVSSLIQLSQRLPKGKLLLGNTGNAITAFAAEMDAGNPAFPDAMACLRKHYHDEGAAGPVATATFMEGPKTSGGSPEVVLRRRQVQQASVDGATLLLRASVGQS